MKKNQRTLWILLTVGTLASVAALFWAALLLVDAGTFDRVWAHHPPMTCRTHTELPGVEDLVRIPNTTLVSLATHSRVLEKGNTFESGLFLYDAEHPDTPPQRMSLPQDLAFAPHGLGYVADLDSMPQDPKGFLHVVNHAGVAQKRGDTVEIFRHTGQVLTHSKSISFADFDTLNGVHPLAEDVFYVTNDFGSASHWVQTFEKFLRIPRGGVHLYNKGNIRTVASGLFFGNGITSSPGGTRLFVAEMLARNLRVYDIVPETGDLREQPSLPLNTAPDNIRFDDAGRLLVAAHPRLLDLNAHSKTPLKEDSPSQVLALSGLAGAAPLQHDTIAVEEVWSDPGSHLSAVSTALAFDGHLLMGMVYRDGLIHCQRNNEAR
jgi:arylesterase/paraoxonase